MTFKGRLIEMSWSEKVLHVAPRHPLGVLKADDDDSKKCIRCFTEIMGPFYTFNEEMYKVFASDEGIKPSDGSDDNSDSDDDFLVRIIRISDGRNYYLHKVCAELPDEMEHPFHPQHTLHLYFSISNWNIKHICDICSEICVGFVYSCGDDTSTCKFIVHLKCASASHKIEDKCHMHPLTPIQLPNTFYCHICRTKGESVSYKCAICPFWVHQNCTLLPNTVKHSDHEDHSLTLLHSVPIAYHKTFNPSCDICHDKLSKFETIYSCVGCLFFAHACCATSSENQPSREDDGRNLTLLPVRKEWTSLISSFVGKYSKCAEDDNTPTEIYHFSHEHPLHLHNIVGQENICEACSQPISGLSYHCTSCNFSLHEFCTQLPDPCNKIHHFSHDHPLYLLNEHANNKNVSGRVCDACSEPVSDPSYGCTQCDYFLHKCCIELPRRIPDPCYPDGKMKLFSPFSNIVLGTFQCYYCGQHSNGFGYSGYNLILDVKCASLSIVPIKHEAHKHALTKITAWLNSCSVCPIHSRWNVNGGLQCESCKFSICPYCVMLPPIINHRYCKHGLRLSYSPIRNYDRDYICDLCEETLEPKFWFYHCSDCEVLAHPRCLTKNAGDWNIKFGKNYKLDEHEHMLTLTSFKHINGRCEVCHNSMNYGYAVGFKCATCDSKIHLKCVDGRLRRLRQLWRQWSL